MSNAQRFENSPRPELSADAQTVVNQLDDTIRTAITPLEYEDALDALEVLRERVLVFEREVMR